MNVYSKVTTNSYGSRIIGSIKGVIFGFILFIGSFILLWINEGRFDFSKMVRNSIEVGHETIDNTIDGKLISVHGNMQTTEAVGDNLYLKDGNYIAVTRNVEMYAWKEKTEKKTETNLGGSETTKTTYKYVKEWTSFPDNSTHFEIPEGHHNPEKAIDSNTYKVNKAKIGIYSINIPSIDLPNFSKIRLVENNLYMDKIQTGGISLINGYLFKGKGNPNNPKVGDVRITYHVLENGVNVTAIGKQQDEGIISFSDEDGHSLYRVFHGSRDDAISTLKHEYLLKLWLLRLLGFVLMWIGFSALLNPISVLLGVLPIAGSISRGIISLISFFVAFIGSILTIFIAITFHNLYILIISIVMVSVLLFIYIKKRRRAKKSVNVTENIVKEEKQTENINISGMSDQTNGINQKPITKDDSGMVDFDIE